MFNYIRSKDTADKLIAKYGQSAFLRRKNVSGPDYDPVLSGPKDFSVKIFVDKFSDWEVGQGRVRVSDKKVYMSVGTLTIEPREDDKIVIGGIEHAIVGPASGRGIQRIAPGGVTILYDLQCRR